MKITIGVIASHGHPYDGMKGVWMENVRQFNKRAKNTEIECFFLYGNGNTQKKRVVELERGIYDFISPHEESIQNIIRKTLDFFEYRHVVCDTETRFILRTNLSTLFAFDGLQRYLESVSGLPMFFGGCFIDGFEGIRTKVSGTCMVFGLDTVAHLLDTAQALRESPYNDDLAISHQLFFANYHKITSKEIKRLDFIHTVRFQSCPHFDDNDLFCFRFRTQSRKHDVALMKLVYSRACTGSTFESRTCIDEAHHTGLLEGIDSITTDFSDSAQTFAAMPFRFVVSLQTYGSLSVRVQFVQPPQSKRKQQTESSARIQ